MATPIEQYIIEQVRSLRAERGISQTDLAFALGVSKGFIGAVENPKQRAKYNIEHLNKLAIIFNCKFADFFPDQPFNEEI